MGLFGALSIEGPKWCGKTWTALSHANSVVYILRDLLVYSEAIGAKLSHYHDANDLEVDAIIELGTKWAGVEIKMGAHRVSDGAASLMRLRNKLMSKGASAPAFLCVITGGGPLFSREDGIHVIPIDCLKP